MLGATGRAADGNHPVSRHGTARAAGARREGDSAGGIGWLAGVAGHAEGRVAVACGRQRREAEGERWSRAGNAEAARDRRRRVVETAGGLVTSLASGNGAAAGSGDGDERVADGAGARGSEGHGEERCRVGTERERRVPVGLVAECVEVDELTVEAAGATPDNFAVQELDLIPIAVERDVAAVGTLRADRSAALRAAEITNLKVPKGCRPRAPAHAVGIRDGFGQFV